ncbi:hypothetical protein M4R23_24255, partial [Acidovorax sp. GBBC 3332]
MGWKTLHVGVVAAALTAAGLTALGFGTWFLYQEKAGGAVAGLGAGLALLFAATIGHLSQPPPASFSGVSSDSSAPNALGHLHGGWDAAHVP